MERVRIVTRLREIPGFFVLIFLLIVATPIYADLPPEEEGICVRVRIRISQDITIARTAFRATLEINNALENVPLENLIVTLDIRNWEQESSNQLFAIRAPEVTGISDMDGNGTLEPGTSGKAVWTIVPTRDAAPIVPTRYWVGGTLSYIEAGTQFDMPLLPAPIWVRPDPLLVLRYFLVRNVYSDDPFTPEKEPAEPFPLGLIMINQGKGTANQVRITSSQPEIIENEKGLLIEFKIIGTQVNTDQVSPSLTVNLGNIESGRTAVAQWLITSSLQGKFIEYTATFEHVDDLGDLRTSLIDSVEIHELLHSVRVDSPRDDYKPDFLANDVPDDDFLPDTLYNSDGSTEVVNVGLNPVVEGPVTQNKLEVTLSADVPNGWIYIRTEDPGQEQFRLEHVLRSDGREIMVDANAWTTHRTIRYKGQPPYREHLLHLFDFVDRSDYMYTLFYTPIEIDDDPPVTFIHFSGEVDYVDGIYYILPETLIYFEVEDESPVSTYYRLDNDPDFHPVYAFNIPQIGMHSLEYYSEDSKGNSELPKTVILNVGAVQDRDFDGLTDELESRIGSCTDLYDADSDDDGLLDGVEDANQNGIVDPGETDPCNADTDGDGIQDGTEQGVTEPVPDPDGDGPLMGTDTDIFVPDEDPTSTTDSLDSDSDDDGILDGLEDTNQNGFADSGETDPYNPDTDGDTYDDGSEVFTGSDPLNEYSHPGVTIVQLGEGFNMVAIPADVKYMPHLRDWLPVIGNAMEVEKVMVYDESADSFVTMIPEDPSNESFILQGGEGLIVYALGDKQIEFTTILDSSHDLHQGFNLIGIANPPVGYSAYQLLSALGQENVASVQRYSIETGIFETAGFTADGQIVGIDFSVVPGEGCFIFMRQEVLGFRF